MLIEIEGLTKYYETGGEPAVAGVTTQIDRGEFVFLVGPSGAGKSTLIKLIFREELPSSGTIKFLGQDIGKYKPKDILKHRRQIGLVFQDFRLLKEKTVFENVAFALEIVGSPLKEINAKVSRALARVGLEGKEKVFPAQLSGGEQQRVGIARAIVKEPQVIIADEPTGNVDRDTSDRLMKVFEEINAGGTTIIIATHAWDVVDRMQKRVIALEKGILVRDEEQGSYSYEH